MPHARVDSPSKFLPTAYHKVFATRISSSSISWSLAICCKHHLFADRTAIGNVPNRVGSRAWSQLLCLQCSMLSGIWACGLFTIRWQCIELHLLVLQIVLRSNCHCRASQMDGDSFARQVYTVETASRAKIRQIWASMPQESRCRTAADFGFADSAEFGLCLLSTVASDRAFSAAEAEEKTTHGDGWIEHGVAVAARKSVLGFLHVRGHMCTWVHDTDLRRTKTPQDSTKTPCLTAPLASRQSPVLRVTAKFDEDAQSLPTASAS